METTPVHLPGKSHGLRSLVGCSPWGSWKVGHLVSDFTFTFHFHALEKEMATHFSVLAWKIPGMGEPGGLPSVGSHRVRHNWSDLAGAAAAVNSGLPRIQTQFLKKKPYFPSLGKCKKLIRGFIICKQQPWFLTNLLSLKQWSFHTCSQCLVVDLAHSKLKLFNFKLLGNTQV